jgi:hypothetical protein
MGLKLLKRHIKILLKIIQSGISGEIICLNSSPSLGVLDSSSSP